VQPSPCTELTSTSGMSFCTNSLWCRIRFCTSIVCSVWVPICLVPPMWRMASMAHQTFFFLHSFIFRSIVLIATGI
jgi:hypothetical protein